MFTILLLLAGGIGIGYLMQRIHFLQHIDKSINLTVYALLFLFGIHIGSDQKLIESFHTLGLQAFVISFAGIIGSLLVTYIAYKVWKKRSGERRDDEK